MGACVVDTSSLGLKKGGGQSLSISCKHGSGGPVQVVMTRPGMEGKQMNMNVAEVENGAAAAGGIVIEDCEEEEF